MLIVLLGYGNEINGDTNFKKRHRKVENLPKKRQLEIKMRFNRIAEAKDNMGTCMTTRNQSTGWLPVNAFGKSYQFVFSLY